MIGTLGSHVIGTRSCRPHAAQEVSWEVSHLVNAMSI